MKETLWGLLYAAAAIMTAIAILALSIACYIFWPAPRAEIFDLNMERCFKTIGVQYTRDDERQQLEVPADQVLRAYSCS